MPTDTPPTKTIRRRSVALLTATSLAALGGMWGVGVGVAGAQSASRQHVVTAAAGAIPTSVAATFEVTVGRGGHTTTIRGSGQADLAHAALVGTVVLPAMGHLLTTPTPLTVELVGSTIYVKVPAQFARFVGGATWVSIAVPAAQAAHLGADFTAVATGLGDTDDILALHTGTLTPLGTKVIDGVTATGTRGNFPVAALLAALPGVSSSLGTGLSHLGTISLPLSLWAGPDGRLLQVTVADTLSTKGGPVTVSAEVDLSGYDSPVSIQPPPSGSVTALPSGALGMLGGLSGRAGVHGSWSAHGGAGHPAGASSWRSRWSHGTATGSGTSAVTG